ncbi:GAF domain-containing protein [Pseudonocardia sp. MH-G8]|uniref:helix-turn-helix domain-containing protein n=1 Tax=Pseudonocardia sp. MH-G8 TaxID=1854588 RepID=UPI001179E520|nr:GAF domain-containing protein [Pseudonocardia sp. MH-G8]
MPCDQTGTPSSSEGGRVVVHQEPPDAAVLFAGEPTSAELSSWLDAIAEITRAANRGAPLKELLDLIAGATARLTGYDFCAVFVEDPERESLVIKGSYGLSQEYVDTINAQTPIPVGPGDTGEGPTSRAFRSQRPTSVLNIFDDAALRAWEAVAAQQGYASLLSVPLVVGQIPFGLLNCYTVEKHDFTAREIMLMESMANQAGLAIETTRRLTKAYEQVEGHHDTSAALRAELEAIEHANAKHGELLRVVLKGGGLAAIAEKLSAMLRCTVAIDDATGHLLAAAAGPGGAGARDGSVAAVHRRARTRAGTAADARTVVIGPGHDPLEPEGLVVPVVVDEDVAGHLWALCPRVPFGDRHCQALVRAAAVVAFALLKERTAQEVEWRLSRDFLDDLLEVEGPLGEALHARARQLGADLAEPHTVLVIRRDAAHGDDPHAVHADREAYAQRSLLSLVQRTGAACEGATLTATRSDHVVVLWRDVQGRSAAQFAHHLRREVLAYAGGWTATISVGPRCTDVQEYGDAYRLTCSVLDLVQQSDRGDRVVVLDDIGAYRLLLQVKRPRELQSFAQAVLGGVHDYDVQHQAKLGLTLRTYMSHGCNAALTAKKLHVHPNTVGYRLRRIQRLLDVELADPQVLLHVQLALMIEAILGD